ncbi:hypothetical protein D8674_006635 [Pyrus ussuriensis x Pyrus communis]|uniref:non-specific serine/threonine protein kinase n=1 Tax=Pyrus ussuriensis x Pyrus communis TaxID=2448454 RepID=A0A5N5FUT8_9ROSA|nr:hypothetical protein D8674_006635 [Pyrus ussuriensis x Pyrus communis]
MGVLVVKLILIYLLFSAVFDCCWSSLQSGLGGNATDRLALLAIKAQIKQDLHNYNVMSSWNDSTHFCMWHGVTCSRRHRQRVTNLDLQSQNLVGKLSPNIGNLSFLRELSLQNNSFSHEIPPQIGNLRRLQVLRLDVNSFSGSIPHNISYCFNLVVVNFSRNKLVGKIPSEIGLLSKLQKFALEYNNVTGQVPPSLGNLSSLQGLGLSVNNLMGNIPDKKRKEISITGNTRLYGGSANLQLQVQCSPKCSRKKRKEISLSTLGNTILQVSYDALLKATNRFSEANLIGAGSFGSVYKGVLDEDDKAQLVVVKVFNLLRHGASRSFIAECEALRNIRHRNLVKIITVCSSVDFHGNDFKALVYEFMDNGSLKEWLHLPTGTEELRDHAPKKLSLVQRLEIAIGVACALDYLHNHCETPVVHCDLKPSNVLLDNELTSHVSDFGLARFLSQTSSVGIRRTVGYATPEYGMGSEVSRNGDVYNFGILLLEMFTGNRPTDNMFGDSFNLHNFVKMALPGELLRLQMHHFFKEARTRIPINVCLSSIFRIGIACVC